MLAVPAEHSPTRAGMDRVYQVVLVVVAVKVAVVVRHQEGEGDGKLVTRRRTIKMLTGIGGKWKEQDSVYILHCAMQYTLQVYRSRRFVLNVAPDTPARRYCRHSCGHCQNAALR